MAWNGCWVLSGGVGLSRSGGQVWVVRRCWSLVGNWIRIGNCSNRVGDRLGSGERLWCATLEGLATLSWNVIEGASRGTVQVVGASVVTSEVSECCIVTDTCLFTAVIPGVSLVMFNTLVNADIRCGWNSCLVTEAAELPAVV